MPHTTDIGYSTIGHHHIGVLHRFIVAMLSLFGILFTKFLGTLECSVRFIIALTVRFSILILILENWIANF